MALKSRRVGHKLVMRTAQGIAQSAYEELAKDNAFYKLNPNPGKWIHAAWPQFVEPARATLAEMLKGNYSDTLKQEIMDALILDNPLRFKEITNVR